MQRNLADWNAIKFSDHKLCVICKYRRRYEINKCEINKCYHSDPEFRGKPCGIVIHEQWEAAGKPPRLSCRYMEART